jgi:activator of HSP90 ATPase
MRDETATEQYLPSRRSVIGIGGALLTLSACGQAGPAAPAPADDPRTRTSLRQEERFAAAPARVYEVLLSGAEFAAFSGQRAEIDPRVGGAFSLFDGQVVGIIIDLVPAQRIVQAWRAIGDWPPGIFSIVHFALAPIAAGTALTLDHNGFRPGNFDHLNAGWPPHYWIPMRRYLAAHR